MPTRVREDAVRAELMSRARAEVAAAAGSNTLVSKTEQKALPEDLDRAADFARRAEGRGARIDVDEVVASYAAYVGQVFDAVNTRGKTWLSKTETAAIRDPLLKARVWDVRAALLSQTLTNAELATRAASFVKNNVSDVADPSAALFPPLGGGNAGLRATLVTGADAARLAVLGNLWHDGANGSDPNARPFPSFDPAKQSMVVVRTTPSDDARLFVSAIDRKTGDVTFGIEIEPSSVFWRLSQADFERAVAPLSDFGATEYRYNQLPADQVIERMAGTGAELDIGNPYVGFPAARDAAIRATAARVLADYGISNIRMDLFPAVIDVQEKLPGSTVTFEAALRAALDSFFNDYGDAESPIALIVEDVMTGSSWPPTAADLAEARSRLRTAMNDPRASLRVLNLDERPEGDEDPAASWIVHLYMDQISDHSHWAVVDRSDATATYNYGFN